MSLIYLVLFLSTQQVNSDVALLARLCVSEAQGMQEVRVNACLSVVDAVYSRIEQEILTDGTVYGTLEWHNGEIGEYQVWQFPPWVTYGCWDGMARWACDDGYDPSWAVRTVKAYLSGARGSCSGFLYYNSIPYGYQDCLIQSRNGQFIEFFNPR